MRPCLYCKKDRGLKYTKYCSKECFRLFVLEKNARFCIVCGEKCKKQGGIKYCSRKCMGVNMTGDKNASKQPEVIAKIKNNQNNIDSRFKNGEHPWNYQLTKETDARVANYVIKQTEYRQKPVFRNSISQKMGERVINGKLKPVGIRGYFTSVKNNKDMFYRSSWELIAMKFFETMNSVVRYEYEALSLPYEENGSIHHTIPDFVVHYTDGTKQIVEVKPQFKIDKNLYNTRKKLEVMESFAKNNGYGFSLLTEKELNISTKYTR